MFTVLNRGISLAEHFNLWGMSGHWQKTHNAPRVGLRSLDIRQLQVISNLRSDPVVTDSVHRTPDSHAQDRQQ